MRYGYVSPMQSPLIRSKARSKYTYDNNIFDSKIEMCFYIWLRDNNVSFIFKPHITFSYEFDGKIHFYIPDFKVDDYYVELKGNQFFKKDGTMQNPFDHSLDALYEAKHQCMIRNNVKIIKQSDCEIYINYVNNKYGKKFCKQFKVQK